jgi:hypothetical protein
MKRCHNRSISAPSVILGAATAFRPEQAGDPAEEWSAGRNFAGFAGFLRWIPDHRRGRKVPRSVEDDGIIVVSSAP